MTGSDVWAVEPRLPAGARVLTWLLITTLAFTSALAALESVA